MRTETSDRTMRNRNFDASSNWGARLTGRAGILILVGRAGVHEKRRLGL